MDDLQIPVNPMLDGLEEEKYISLGDEITLNFSCNITHDQAQLLCDFMNFVKAFDDKEGVRTVVNEWIDKCASLGVSSQ